MPQPIKGTISGSRAATILNMNQWETSFSVWQKIMEEREPGFNLKQGYELPVFEENASIRFGNAFEDANIEITKDKLRADIIERENIYRNGEKILSCHIDGIIESDTLIAIPLPNGEFITTETLSILYEGKTTSSMSFRNKWGDPGTDKIPANYQIQVQHNMMLTGLKECIVAVLVFPETPEKWESMGWDVTSDKINGFTKIQKVKILSSNDTLLSGDSVKVGHHYYNTIFLAQALEYMGYHHLYYIKRNDELIELMKQKYQEFWTDFVIPRIPPKPMNLDDIKRLCPEPVGTIVIQDQEIINVYNEYKSINKEISKSGNLGKRVNQLKTMFLDQARKLGAVEDDESKDRWIFRDSQGKKLCSWSKNKNGYWGLR